jgi:high-affinity K+ transport system ATPase subunit B
MLTALYYTISLSLLVTMVCLTRLHDKDNKAPISFQLLVLCIQLIHVGTYLSGLFNGIGLARMARQTEDEAKAKQLQECSPNKQDRSQSLLSEAGYQRV